MMAPLLRQRVCSRCRKPGFLLPWPFSRKKPRYIEEACRACILEVQSVVDQLQGER